ncbi:MAG: prevent-host-death protein [Deltaproteobacteria bacterium]|nr:prevent-host-death protein [Deltaproteobacteria bacterium]
MGTAAVSATEAVRSFSELLSNIHYRGDHYTILRGGRPVATMGPVETAPARRTLAELVALVRELPGLDPKDTSFADDVSEAASCQPRLPNVPPWE